MFESKRKTIEEQTLIIDDARLVDVRVTGNGTIDVSYIMERDDTEIRLTVSMQRTHAVDIAKKLGALQPDQLRAMHARIAAQEEPPAPVVEETPKEEPKPTPKPAVRVVELKPGPTQHINWKDPQLTHKRTRLTDEQIERLLHAVFRYRTKYRHYVRTDRGFESFQHYIEVTLPKQFGVTKDVAKGIYAARSYTHITLGYKAQWGSFIKEMTKYKLERQIPRYLMERWSTYR
jgi:hypothetical protein